MSNIQPVDPPPARPRPFGDVQKLRVALECADVRPAIERWRADNKRAREEYGVARAAWEERNPDAAAELRAKEAEEERQIEAEQEREWRRWGYPAGCTARARAEEQLSQGRRDRLRLRLVRGGGERE